MDFSKEQWEEWLSIDKVTTTPKLYFGKYFFRADFEVPLAHFVRHVRFNRPYYIKSIRDDILREKERQYRFNYHTLEPKTAGGDYAEDMADVIVALRIAASAENTRLRIEGNRVRIFSVSADPIKELLRSNSFSRTLFKGIEQPADLSTLASLNEGTIYSKTPPKHKFKVTIKSKRYTPEVKQQITNYVKNYPNGFHFTDGLRSRLNNSGNAWLEGYYYVDDSSLLTFLAMVCPSFVHKVNKLELAA
jgi:hypothetical protein